jgi:3-oxoacyl-[acyl-carrier protein] reductase
VLSLLAFLLSTASLARSVHSRIPSLVEILDKPGLIGKTETFAPRAIASKNSWILMDSGLANRVVMVTGASGGLGAPIARAFAAEGARVIAHYRQQGEQASRLAAELGSGSVALQADLTNEADVERLFQSAERALGPVEILVANAGVWPADDVSVADMSLERWNHTIASDLTSVFLCMRAFFRGIRAHAIKDPAAVMVGSTAGVFGEAGHADYAAAKAGLTYGLLRTLKNEICRLAPKGRVNVVCPGWIRTDMTARYLSDPDLVRRTLHTVALRKIGRPEDIASAIVYLASSKLAGHITGEVLTVSGGMEGRVLYSGEEIDRTCQ